MRTIVHPDFLGRPLIPAPGDCPNSTCYNTLATGLKASINVYFNGWHLAAQVPHLATPKTTRCTGKLQNAAHMHKQYGVRPAVQQMESVACSLQAVLALTCSVSGWPILLPLSLPSIVTKPACLQQTLAVYRPCPWGFTGTPWSPASTHHMSRTDTHIFTRAHITEGFWQR